MILCSLRCALGACFCVGSVWGRLQLIDHGWSIQQDPTVVCLPQRGGPFRPPCMHACMAASATMMMRMMGHWNFSAGRMYTACTSRKKPRAAACARGSRGSQVTPVAEEEAKPRTVRTPTCMHTTMALHHRLACMRLVPNAALTSASGSAVAAAAHGCAAVGLVGRSAGLPTTACIISL